MTAIGSLWLVPNTLDFGVAGESARLDELLPLSAIRIAARLQHWACENARTTRAFLKRVDAVCPLSHPLQELSIIELPRPNKGKSASTAPAEVASLLAPAHEGHDVGLLSEAGLPALAPGSERTAMPAAWAAATRSVPGSASAGSPRRRHCRS